MLRTALIFSERSTCSRLKVGTVIASADLTTIDSVGYNGNAKGLPNKCDSSKPGNCGDLHSEINAIIKGNYNLKDKIMFVTDSPCVMCAKAIINAGIAKVYYLRKYRNTWGIKLLEISGIEVYQWDLDNDRSIE
jgi:dCMP deaminase